MLSPEYRRAKGELEAIPMKTRGLRLSGEDSGVSGEECRYPPPPNVPHVGPRGKSSVHAGVGGEYGLPRGLCYRGGPHRDSGHVSRSAEVAGGVLRALGLTTGAVGSNESPHPANGDLFCALRLRLCASVRQSGMGLSGSLRRAEALDLNLSGPSWRALNGRRDLVAIS